MYIKPQRLLLPHHRAALESSAIAPEVIAERPYFSAQNKAELLSLGLAAFQARAPALVCLLRWPGVPDLPQIKPDDPRPDKDKPGKVIKYETPARAILHADCPPRCWPLLSDPSVPVVITEGVKKADALATAGACAIALPGVWGAVRRKQGGGYELRPEWADVPLRGRRVDLVFDSDVSRKEEVAAALNVLLECLKRKGADVWIVYLPDGSDGQKVGADDFLAAGHGLNDLFALAVPAQFSQKKQFRGQNPAPENTPWEAPVPFGTHNPPSFPVKALGGRLAPFVEALAEATQTPPDIAGTLLLPGLATCVQGKAVIEGAPGWHEPLMLYGAAVAEPATRKSAVVKQISAPLLRHERHEISRREPLREEAEHKRDLLTRKLEHAKQQAVKGKRSDDRLTGEADVQTYRGELAALEVPGQFRLFTEDCSVERLPGLMQENGGRMAVLSAEGDVLAIMAGRYSDRGPNLLIFKKGHTGETFQSDRVGRKGEYIQTPALTLGVAFQPSVLRDLFKVPALRGEGLLARILYAVPTSRVGHRKIRPTPIPKIRRTRAPAPAGTGRGASNPYWRGDLQKRNGPSLLWSVPDPAGQRRVRARNALRASNNTPT